MPVSFCFFRPGRVDFVLTVPALTSRTAGYSTRTSSGVGGTLSGGRLYPYSLISSFFALSIAIKTSRFIGATLLRLAPDSRYRSCPQTSLLTWWLAFDQFHLARRKNPNNPRLAGHEIYIVMPLFSLPRIPPCSSTLHPHRNIHHILLQIDPSSHIALRIIHP